MRATTESQPLLDFVDVGRRFQRAVNLERDAGARDALQGYLFTPAAHKALSQINDGLQRADGDRAWSLVGPYGSGKSAFAVFLADLLSPQDTPERSTARRLLNGKNGGTVPAQELHPALLTAERAPLDVLLFRALKTTLDRVWKTRIGRKPKVLRTVSGYLNGSAPSVARCATSEVVRCFEAAARSVADATDAGLLLIVDEAGKALEYAAQEPRRGDVFLLQALAEAAARSDAPFVIMTVLHQSFGHYAHQLSNAERNEWAKVQGRFGDLAFREGGDQLIRLTAEAITRRGASPASKDWKRLVASTARWVAEGTGWNERALKQALDACWPLYPVTAALLGPLFRGRLAQNERSLFAFLSAGEPFSFRDFLRTHGAADLYTVDRLYDYALGVLGSRLFGREGRSWAEIDGALRRCSAAATALDERIVKTVGLLGMLGDQVGLRASADVVAAACGGDRSEVDSVLERLKAESVFVYRQFRDSYRIWEGSDLDLDALIAEAVQRLPADTSVAAAVQRLAPRAPLVARRHLYETGTFRYFDVRFVDADLLLRQEEPTLEGSGDGNILLALPRTEQEALDLQAQGEALSMAADQRANGKPVILVTPDASNRLAHVVLELAAAEVVQTSTPALQSDPTARTELSGRIDDLGRRLAIEIERAFDPGLSAWHTAGERLPLQSWREATSDLSALCDEHYHAAPPIRNELLNRRILSSSAARARRNLMEAMIFRTRGQVGVRPAEADHRSALAGNRPLPFGYRSGPPAAERTL